MVPLLQSQELYNKYRDLRILIRNRDNVLVTFPQLFVKASPFHQQLFLLAYDFKVREPKETVEPVVRI
jgi:hypothetical protein